MKANRHMSEEQRRPAQLSVRLEDELRRAVEQRARAERRSVSNYIATVVAAAVGEDRGAAA
jgi:predicted transcriptional regulator